MVAQGSICFAWILQCAAFAAQSLAVQASSHYEVLGISRAASLREVQQAYRQAALLEHPDKSNRPDAASRFLRVAEAFEVLRQSESRHSYDQELVRGSGERSRSWGTSTHASTHVDPYELFKDQVGDVYQHWQPGYRVEGDILLNHERSHIVLFPNGSSEVHESKDSGMHRFMKVGVGWCLFDHEPGMMAREGLDELECRQKCVDMYPTCEAYAYESQRSREGSESDRSSSGSCELYQRENLPRRVVASDGTRQVLCYQQDDAAFDAFSSVFRSEITVTKPDGTQSGVTRVMFCQQQRPTTSAIGTAVGSAGSLGGTGWWMATKQLLLGRLWADSQKEL
ncbi:unnamed protein product [Polarella glacialis]|uniref:J domain-containing protein n=1 Tax=Polarella glacialis TaxID=89957 RepID=A0A813GZ51_POLGL|nr:unnamed protein product [Polarella glacialis]